MNTELQEIQRYGRNKTTAINYSYINSGEFRKKFDRISDDKELNRKVYQIAKKILKHRSGTNYEDMYWIDIDSLEIVAFNSALQNKYQICLVCCHDGKIFMYHSNNYVIEFFYRNTVAKYKRKGFCEYAAQMEALSTFQVDGDIFLKEV